MNAPLFLQWLDRARDDLAVARLSLREKYYAHACFLSQQSIEKALKGYLIKATHAHPRVHNLVDLLARCQQHEPAFAQFADGCASVDQYYIPARYPNGVPGSLPDGLPGEQHAEKALRVAEDVYTFVARLLTPV